MPRRKASEVDEEVQEPIKKKETFVTRWFNDYCVDNNSDLKIVCDATARSCEEQFALYLKSGHTETYAAIFYGTYATILAFLRERQKFYKNFTMEIANSINIGYCNNDDENNEKVGNFMPVLEYIGINRSVVDSNTDELTTSTTAENYIRWKELNTKKNAEYYKEIQERAYDYLKKEFKISLRTSEAVIPIFCIFIDHCFSRAKMMYKELIDTNISEVKMNVLNLFDIYYSYNEAEGVEVIELQPLVYTKLALKSDERAEI